MLSLLPRFAQKPGSRDIAQEPTGSWLPSHLQYQNPMLISAQCHSTGTKAGDPLEIAAIARVFGRKDENAEGTYIGSVYFVPFGGVTRTSRC